MKHALMGSLMVLAMVLLLVVLAEALLRLVYPGKDPETELRPRNVAFYFHPDYLIGLKPGLTKTFRRAGDNGGEEITWRTNAAGFRGAALKSAYDLRVMVYGDSNVQARFSRLEDSFPYRLGEELSRLTGQTIDVINAGVVGAGPDQSYIRMQTEVDLYRPDIVILQVFTDNDFGDIVRNRLFEIDASGALVESNLPRDLTPWERHELGETFLQKYLAPFHLTLAADRLAKRLGLQPEKQEVPLNPADSESWLEQLLAEEFAVYAEGAPRHYSHFADHYDWDLAVHPGSTPSRVKAKLMLGLLAGVRDFLMARGIRLLVLILPSPRDLTTNQPLNHRVLARHPDYRPQNLTSAVVKICEALELQCLDLFDEYATNNPNELYFRGENNHWNDAGQALAARLTADYLYQQSLE